MSRFKTVMKKCVVCGHEAEYKLIMSTSSFGSMDLDTRPPALARFLLSDQVEFCEHCGYANIDINYLSRENVQEYMETDEYQNILNYLALHLFCILKVILHNTFSHQN